ncbi:unnamed protein product [Didymodactylos carnosus]|uniref:Oxidation resistance protein 1 n=1 Tax=Didymodactylos carnosus TaxID=1234261 RepID=A0A8S2W0R0_9BILA|nr:unnamed protein product [Didymodactylos carnosus]CAF4425692.1 unnamed protein product [Didymodactylos carnosus]
MKVFIADLDGRLPVQTVTGYNYHMKANDSCRLFLLGIINVDEIRAHRNVLDFGITAPKLFQPSLLLSEEQIKQILLELPARVHACNWNLTFSTENHGFSLNALYRRSIEQDSNSTSLLVVKDIEQNV